MINLDTGSTFAVGKYDSSLESMHLRSNATTGAAIREVLDYSRGVYKWASVFKNRKPFQPGNLRSRALMGCFAPPPPSEGGAKQPISDLSVRWPAALAFC